MAAGLRPLRINTVDLLRQPGSRRDVEASIAATELDIADDRVTGPVEVRATAESTVDGIVVHGTVTVAWTDECRRCLAAIAHREPIDVDELYQEEVVDDDAFEIGRDALDLTPMVRDATALALDAPPTLCRDDCAGLCPVCGADRNESPCGCDTDVVDERWAALRELDLDDG